MTPQSLPLVEDWESEDQYIESLLSFSTSSDLFRNLCGGIHILDFLTREPDLYSSVLPSAWRNWFELQEIGDILDLLLREDVSLLTDDRMSEWRSGPLPPQSMREFIQNIRRHSLKRDFCPPPSTNNGNGLGISRQIAVGMNPKKIHEVESFARFVDRLSSELKDPAENVAASPSIVDFGSGQNYLGRALATTPYEKHVFAVERKHENIFGAKGMDVLAKLAKKKKTMRNKKEFVKLKSELGAKDASEAINQDRVNATVPQSVLHDDAGAVTVQERGSQGSITYVEHEIKNGELGFLLEEPVATNGKGRQNKYMVVSLHSCGNLSNHALRSLVLNDSVAAIAVIGCCYNLMTERLGPATYKLPILRPYHPRLEATSTTYDPHGFPISKHLEMYEHKYGHGVRLNITARMMAVQAPYNWGPVDSEAFFTRHFYRAVLQRIFVDFGVISKPSDPHNIVECSQSDNNSPATPLIIGSLKKQCFTSFKAYVRGALERLNDDPIHGGIVRERLSEFSDSDIEEYETRFHVHKKRLSVMWSLMAFAASVVESIVVVDRWLYLREQDCVKDCWVEAVFDYSYSPRNLVVVGVKK